MAAVKKTICFLLLSVLGLSHGETCPSYTDDHGNDEDAFDCPRPDDDLDETYCCISSSGDYEYCCDKSTYDSYYGFSFSVTYIVVISVCAVVACLSAAFGVWARIRRRRILQGSDRFVSSRGHCNPYPVNDVTYQPPPNATPMQSAPMSLPQPSAPPIYECITDDPPPPYPGGPAPPTAEENENPE